MHTSHWNGLISCRSSSTVQCSRIAWMQNDDEHVYRHTALRRRRRRDSLLSRWWMMQPLLSWLPPMTWLTGSVPRDSLTSVVRIRIIILWSSLARVLDWCRRCWYADPGVVEEGIRAESENEIYSATYRFYRSQFAALSSASVCRCSDNARHTPPAAGPLLPTPPAWPGFHSCGS